MNKDWKPYSSEEDHVIKTDHLENHGSPDRLAAGGKDIFPYGIHVSNESSQRIGGAAFFVPGGAVGCFR